MCRKVNEIIQSIVNIVNIVVKNAYLENLQYAKCLYDSCSMSNLIKITLRNLNKKIHVIIEI